MHTKSIVSAIALSAALALSGPAFAQTVFNGAELSAEDLPAVTERCEQLVNAAETESVSTEADTTDSTAAETETTADSTDATLEETPAVNEAEAATTTSIDLDTITLEMCTEAGLGGAM